MMLQKHWENYYLELIRGTKSGSFANFLRGFLHLLSKIYQPCITCRNWLFDQGWFRCYHPPVPMVMSVGNLVCGGTGKTPVTLMLAQELGKEFQVAILLRGYRSRAEKLSTPVTLSKGKGPMHSAIFCGDESFLLSQNLPNVFVFVGKDRRTSSNMAAKAGAQLILLDDGMQHRKLARDVEVVVLDGKNPFGSGHLLPRGLLREGIESLSRSDLVIVNHAQDTKHLKQRIAQYTAAPIVSTRVEVSQILDLQNGTIPSLQNKKVGVFCGIGKPENFLDTVRDQGADIVNNYFLPDHEPFETDLLDKFAKKCRVLGAEYLVCTEKDKVKLEENISVSLPITWLKMQLHIVEGHEHWKVFIEQAKAKLARNT